MMEMLDLGLALIELSECVHGGGEQVDDMHGNVLGFNAAIQVSRLSICFKS